MFSQVRSPPPSPHLGVTKRTLTGTREHLAVPGEHGLEAELLRPRAAALGELIPASPVVEQCEEPLCERCLVAGRDERAVTPAREDVRGACGVARDDRYAERHRLGEDVAEALR